MSIRQQLEQSLADNHLDRLEIGTIVAYKHSCGEVLIPVMIDRVQRSVKLEWYPFGYPGSTMFDPPDPEEDARKERIRALSSELAKHLGQEEKPHLVVPKEVFDRVMA